MEEELQAQHLVGAKASVLRTSISMDVCLSPLFLSFCITPFLMSSSCFNLSITVVDMAIFNGGGEFPFNVGPTQLYLNTPNRNNWIEIELYPFYFFFDYSFLYFLSSIFLFSPSLFIFFFFFFDKPENWNGRHSRWSGSSGGCQSG